jgi:hypothetical protein
LLLLSNNFASSVEINKDYPYIVKVKISVLILNSF